VASTREARVARQSALVYVNAVSGMNLEGVSPIAQMSLFPSSQPHSHHTLPFSPCLPPPRAPISPTAIVPHSAIFLPSLITLYFGRDHCPLTSDVMASCCCPNCELFVHNCTQFSEPGILLRGLRPLIRLPHLPDTECRECRHLRSHVA
jgi:hypothetical protein